METGGGRSPRRHELNSIVGVEPPERDPEAWVPVAVQAGCPRILPPPRPGQIVLDVEALGLDGVAFRDLWHRCDGDLDAMAFEVEERVARHGGAFFRASGTGATLGGMVAASSVDSPRRRTWPPAGSRLATLAPAVGVPLQLDEIVDVCPSLRQVRVRGRGILGEGVATAAIPDGWPMAGAVAVVGAAEVVSTVRKIVRAGSRVLVLGASGVSGILATFTAAECVGTRGRVVGLVPCPGQLHALGEVPNLVTPAIADATGTFETLRALLTALGGQLADLTLDCTTARGTEATAIACTRPGGEVPYFNLAASAARALSDERAMDRQLSLRFGCDAEPGADAEALALVARHPALLRRFAPSLLRHPDTV